MTAFWDTLVANRRAIPVFGNIGLEGGRALVLDWSINGPSMDTF